MKAVASFLVLALVLAGPALADRKLLQSPTIAPAPSRPVLSNFTAQSSFLPPGLNDTNVLNFLLNLEYLEGEFFTYAVNGSGLDQALAGSGPASVGGAKANLTEDLQATIAEFASLDKQRISDLRSGLHNAAVARPLINIGSAFSDAANMALNTTLSPAFSPYADDLSFLEGAFLFADLQVKAYKSALGMLNSTATLDFVTSIMIAKAYQAGVIRELLYYNRGTETPYGINSSSVVQAFATLNFKLAGFSTTNGIMNGNQAYLVPTTSTYIYQWDPQRTMRVLCLGANPGGFLPTGVNGPNGPVGPTSNPVTG